MKDRPIHDPTTKVGVAMLRELKWIWIWIWLNPYPAQ
jgi:hypothetical protein